MLDYNTICNADSEYNNIVLSIKRLLEKVTFLSKKLYTTQNRFDRQHTQQKITLISLNYLISRLSAVSDAILEIDIHKQYKDLSQKIRLLKQ